MEDGDATRWNGAFSDAIPWNDSFSGDATERNGAVSDAIGGATGNRRRGTWTGRKAPDPAHVREAVLANYFDEVLAGGGWRV